MSGEAVDPPLVFANLRGPQNSRFVVLVFHKFPDVAEILLNRRLPTPGLPSVAACVMTGDYYVLAVAEWGEAE